MFFDRKKKSSTVYTVGAPVLREHAAPVAEINDEIREIASGMLEAMCVFNGIGLAAPQYGKSIRLVVFDVPGDHSTGTPGEMLLLPRMPMAVINPEIVASSSEKATSEEGCLSLPGIYAPVERPAKVVFRAQSLDGEFFEVECGGLLGRCIQHELDHLDGVLFSDRVSSDDARKIRGDLDRLKREGQTKNFRRSKRI